jgi:hypothetical protein
MYYALSDRQSDRRSVRQRVRTTDRHRFISAAEAQGIGPMRDLLNPLREPTAVSRIAGLDTT